MSSPIQIVVAFNDPQGQDIFNRSLNLNFTANFHHVLNGATLIKSIQENNPHILIVDSDFEFELYDSFISFIEHLKTDNPELAILPILPQGEPQLIKDVLGLDLFYFLHKPLDPTETTVSLKRVYENLPERKEETAELPQTAMDPFHGMIGCSRLMRKLFDLIEKVAEDDQATVLIRGESGTGKEMVAKAIHAQSSRAKNNFVPVNCAAIPDDLLESELFGYTKGAFTGATGNKPGRIQYADKGTLFLDEIGDMKSSLQAKLLRVIQEKEFEPVGAFKSIPINTRILAATHCDLEKMVQEGTFREDLYYRLSVIPLTIPALRERTEDIPHLINTFLEKYASKRGREKFTFSNEAIAAVIHYNWRGNVRELENLIQHMSILYSGQHVELADLPEKFQNIKIPKDYRFTPAQILKNEEPAQNHAEISPSHLSVDDYFSASESVDFNELINDFETKLIIRALQQTSGNKKEAAKLLNLKRTTLLEKIKKKEIDGLWEKQNN